MNEFRYSNPTQLVFSGIGNVHAVKDAFEEMRDSIDPVKTESKMDRWRDDSAKMVARRMVSFWMLRAYTLRKLLLLL